MLKIANYARKSNFSDTSDSTDVQYTLGAEYCKSHYADYELYRYEDEGFTGANTSRPDYNRLVADIKDGKLNVVICYKIDRISRNVLDFSNFFSLLTEHNVEFVSIKEQIDTSTPLGRAMMYICSVFAQMERETIAERVTDNMTQLAKSGKWTGGKAPTGFQLKRINIEGKKHSVLVENPEEIPYLNMVVDTFLDGNYSLHGLEAYFRRKGIKTLNGGYFAATQLYNILRNPHYAAADKSTLEYFKSLGCSIGCDESKFTGEYGIIAYGRTSGGKRQKHTVNPPEKWIITVGLHHPLISSEKWLSIQDRFGKNLFDKTRKYKIGILNGVLHCSCGYSMKAKHTVSNACHKAYDNYFCRNRSRRGVEYCDRASVPVAMLDNAVIEILKNIALDKSTIDNYIPKNTEAAAMRSRSEIQKDIDKAEAKINNLTSALGANSDSSAAKYIITEIEQSDKRIAALKYELLELSARERASAKSEKDTENKYKMVCHIVDNLDALDYDELNGLIRDLLKECIWDGANLSIKL
ncbi:MAG: recombinase family protein [Roseburia sp.]|nr:recombinase family protein [Roseburia sp.]